MATTSARRLADVPIGTGAAGTGVESDAMGSIEVRPSTTGADRPSGR